MKNVPQNMIPRKRGWSLPANVTGSSPYRYHQPDLIYGSGFKPIGVKGGIGGALSQPAEFAGRYVYEHYGGVEKTRAIGLKAQYEFNKLSIQAKWQIINTFMVSKYYAKALPQNVFPGKKKQNKKFNYAYSKQYEQYPRSKYIDPHNCSCTRSKRRGKYNSNYYRFKQRSTKQYRKQSKFRKFQRYNQRKYSKWYY